MATRKSPVKKGSAKNEKLKKLVIVESPSKASTIKKYLGKDFEVKASVGHLIDLPKSRMGVNLENFNPDYIVMRDKYKVLKELRESAKTASEIILASDPDREGEAIAWHIKNDFIKNVLPKIKNRTVLIKRVKFTEITEVEIKEQINHSEDIDEKLVNAQQGRRVIDRIFGYQMSPLLWKKVKSKLSAGRVQSVALRIISEKEEEIDRFRPQEYWNIYIDLKKDKSKIRAELSRIDGKKADVTSSKDAHSIESELNKGKSKVKDIKSKNVNRNPSAPFITSTLQQTANNLFGYPSMKTMLIAQQLYEGIDIGKNRTGLITYMRTDSTRISPQALTQVREYIAEKLGKQYLPEKPNTYANRKSSQDAHEAIRPTTISYHPDEVKEFLSGEQFKLYSLIWKRFVASQMNPSLSEQKTLEVENGRYILTAGSTKTVFDGFMRVFDYSKTAKEKELPVDIKIGDTLELLKVDMEQKFTEPPARYTDASLVKAMEELGIGRPSTYAPTIFTLTKRYYVKKEGRSLFPTVLGKAVNKLLVGHFPELVSTTFTRDMEEELDSVEEGKKPWKTVVHDFYQTFHPVLDNAYQNIDSIKGSFDEETEYTCEKCGKKMVKKLGKYGVFIACSGWPECRNARPLPLGKCPQCNDGYIVQKKGKKGRVFFGCTAYPACEFVTYQKPLEENGASVSCPNCGKILFAQKEGGKAKWICLNKECRYEKILD